MSSILKALEKAEASQTRRGSGPSGFARGRQRRSPWAIAGSVLAGAAVAALATYAVMGGFSRHAAPKQPEQVMNAPAAAATNNAIPAKVVEAAKVPAVEVTAKTPASSAAIKPAGAKLVAPHVDKTATPKGTAKAAAKSTTSTATPMNSAVQVKENAALAKEKAAKEKAAKEKAAKEKAAKEKAAKEKAALAKERAALARERAALAREKAAATRTTPPMPAAPAKPLPVAVVKSQPEKPRAALRVNGIAWENDGASSVAMVNGRPVQQGGAVDGYKVEQIYEDKVRFSGSNGKFEVPLGGSE